MAAQGILVSIVIAMLATCASARTLTQSAYSDADIYNFALNLEYLEVRLTAFLLLFTLLERCHRADIESAHLSFPVHADMKPYRICCVLQANFYHCAAYGTPIASNNGGPDPEGCVIGNYDDATLALAVELAGDESNHVLAIQAALG